MNLAQNLTETASEHPDEAAIKLDDVELTYSQFDEASARAAGLLRAKGIEPGHRVGVMLPNIPYFPVVYYGALRAGGAVVPMNVLLKQPEVEHYLADSGAKLLFAWHGFAEAAQGGAADAEVECILVEPGEFESLLGASEPSSEVVERRGDETAAIFYTAGTTGTPKGAELTHSNLGRNAEVCAALVGASTDDVVLGALPLVHPFGQTCALNYAVFVGACLSLMPRFDPAKALEIIERDGVTLFLEVPTSYARMLSVPDRERFDASTLRLCVSGGAAMPLEVLGEFERAFDCIVLEGYGLSETSPVASLNHPDRPRKAGSIGTPIDGVEMKVVDDEGNEVPQGEVGEIVIRGHNVMKGYWNRPEETAKAIDPDGWLHTGDLARVDSDGYFFIVGRKKELIIRGGYNIYPREVEKALCGHPAVREAAVIGLPDPELGEEVGAAVVLDGGTRATAEEIREHVKGQLAAYKYPRKVWIVSELPKSPTGEILKREIELPE
jgi:long-chain acyl-CoA synthetase